MKKELLYKDLAKYYDLVYHWKDYKKESQKIKQLITKYKKSKGKNLLELACGTGKHLKFLHKNFSCIGTDINQGMIQVAKKQIKGPKFKKADMTNFKLGEEFDKEIDQGIAEVSAPKSKARVIILGALLTASLGGIGFLVKMQWDMVQEQAIIKTRVNDLMSRINESIDKKADEDSAQWRLLKGFNDNKVANDLEIKIMKRIQTDIILPLLIHSAKNGKDTSFQPPPSKFPDFKEALEKLDKHRPKVDAEQFKRDQMRKEK